VSKWLKFSPLIVFLGLIPFLFKGLKNNPHDLPSQIIGKNISEWVIPTIDGIKPLHLKAYNREFKLLNFWASWCASCSEEQIYLNSLEQQGVVILGINYKDAPAPAKQWLEEWGNPFKQIGVDPNGTIGMELGVYGTPETFLLDKNGNIVHRFAGILTQEIWNKQFLPLIKKG
jgi:cytochrome c biogenesis protein CcmG/thiol:disulfide interchange protein DsbE